MKRTLTLFALTLSAMSLAPIARADSTIIMNPSNGNGGINLDQRNRVIQPGRGGAYNAGRAAGFISNGGLPRNTVTIQNNDGSTQGTLVNGRYRDSNGGNTSSLQQGAIVNGSYNGGNGTLNPSGNVQQGTTIINGNPNGSAVPLPANGQKGIMIYGANGQQTGTYSGGQYTPAQ